MCIRDRAQSPRLANLALRHALVNDDGALVAQLAAQGMGFGQPLRGSATALEVALMQHAYAAAQALLRAGAPVSADALHRFDRQPPAALVAQLLARGARADLSLIHISCTGSECRNHHADP